MADGYNTVFRRKQAREVSVARIMAQLGKDIKGEEWGMARVRATELHGVLCGLEGDDIWLADHMDEGGEL
jgi:hypothetical protein